MNNDMAALHNAAIALLATREYSRKELEIKLLRRHPDAADLQHVLQTLEDENLQSDTRFAEVFIRQKAEAGKGPHAIRQQLMLKGIAKHVIDDQMHAADIDWFTMAEKVYHKKYQDSAVDNPKEKARRQRFMLSRGFSPAIVSEIL